MHLGGGGFNGLIYRVIFFFIWFFILFKSLHRHHLIPPSFSASGYNSGYLKKKNYRPSPQKINFNSNCTVVFVVLAYIGRDVV